MTRLESLKALMKLPMADDHRRSSRPIEGYEKADDAKVRIKTKRKAAKKPKRSSSRIGWLEGVIERRGA